MYVYVLLMDRITATALQPRKISQPHNRLFLLLYNRNRICQGMKTTRLRLRDVKYLQNNNLLQSTVN